MTRPKGLLSFSTPFEFNLMVFWGSLCEKVWIVELTYNFWGVAFRNFLRDNCYVSICFPLGLRRAHERGVRLAAGSAILERFFVAAKSYWPVACWGRKDIGAGSGSESNSEGSQKLLSKAWLADHVAKFGEKCPNSNDVIIEGLFCLNKLPKGLWDSSYYMLVNCPRRRMQCREASPT